MEQNVLLTAAFGLVVNALIIYIVIQSATKATKRFNMQIATFHMLAKIAKAQGVPQNEIDELYDWIKGI